MENCEPLRYVEYWTFGTVAVAAEAALNPTSRKMNRTRARTGIPPAALYTAYVTGNNRKSGAFWLVCTKGPALSRNPSAFRSPPEPGRELTAREVGTLPDFDDIAVSIPDVAANLAVLGIGFAMNSAPRLFHNS
jgi:hypothetical protein